MQGKFIFKQKTVLYIPTESKFSSDSGNKRTFITSVWYVTMNMKQV